MGHRRWGTIAQQPKAIRDQVNELLQGGRTYRQVVEWLKSNGVPKANLNQVQRWYVGGHQDWLREQVRLAEFRATRDFAFKLAEQQEGSKLSEGTLCLAASQICEALKDFESKKLEELMTQKPESITPVLNSLTRLSKGLLDIDKFKEQARENKEAGKCEATEDKSNVLTAETLEKIERELGLI